MSPEYTVQSVIEDEDDGGEDIYYEPAAPYYPTSVVAAAEAIITAQNPGFTKSEISDAVIDYLLETEDNDARTVFQPS